MFLGEGTEGLGTEELGTEEEGDLISLITR
jgi:hypothetical protein